MGGFLSIEFFRGLFAFFVGGVGEGSNCASNDILEKLFNGFDFLKKILC